jgi:hypothetical protein
VTTVPLLVVTEFAWRHRFAEDVTSKALADLGKYALSWSPHAAQLDPLFARCQSPVERLFLFGWCCQFDIEDIEVLPDEPTAVINGRHRAHTVQVQPVATTVVGKLRPDFLLQVPPRGLSVPYTRLYVEIDGHEFHASTRQQVARDRQRERAVLAGGDVTIRFTGGEVNRDPSGCAAEAIGIARGLAKKRRAA